MLAEERYRKIMELLRRDHTVKVGALAELFHVSAETVRRDLDYLEQAGCLKKVHGGAVLEQVDTHEPEFQEREGLYHEKKWELAQLACRFVKEEDAIALDAGTTSLEIARVLKRRYRTLTILTNSIPIVWELLDKPSFTVILAGGKVHAEEKSVTGGACVEQLRQYRVNYYFLTPSGVSLQSGVTSYGFGEVDVQRAMCQIAAHTVAFCHSGYFDKVSLLKVCDLIRLEGIVTDSSLPEETRLRYEAAGVTVFTPREPQPLSKGDENIEKENPAGPQGELV